MHCRFPGDNKAMESETIDDENMPMDEMKEQYSKFRGRVVRKTDNLVLVFPNSGLNDDHTSMNLEHGQNQTNSNSNNNANNTTPDEFKNSEQLGPPKYLVLLKNSNGVLDYTSTLSETGTTGSTTGEDRFFILHSLESEHEDEAKKFLEKSLVVGTPSLDNDSAKEGKPFKRIEPTLICFPCRFAFTFGPSFAGHVINHHGLDLSDLEVQVLELDNTNAVLQITENNRKVLYLESMEEIPDSLKKEVRLGKALTISERLKVNEVIKSNADPSAGQSGLPDTLNISNQNRARERERKQKNCLKTDLIANSEEETTCSKEDYSATGSLKINSTSFAALYKQSAAADKKTLEESNRNSNRSLKTSSCGTPEHVGGKVLDLSLVTSKSLKLAPTSTSPATIARQRMLECETMSFAVASPLDAHAQSPTAHPVLMNNVMHSDTSNFTHNSKSKGVEFAAFLSQKKAENEQSMDDDFSSSPPPSSSSKNVLNPSSNPENDSSVSSSSLLNASLVANQQSDVDALETSSASLDPFFPMSLFQSRNSCKTLKCPKCNWHYKYRQTLEAHMKEKHFEETSDCVYCNASQPHPRLSRGETYSCGYKPFKCNVCNYSTTTKGNLSIHMQSDKHLYNARSLQQRQQERIRQGGSTTQAGESTNAQNENIQPSLKRSSSPSSGKLTEYNGLSMEKQLHSRRRRSSNKTISSVDSGVSSSTSKIDSPISAGVRRESTSLSGGKWRCDVCCYETGIARNLRIHMTSEKHAQNLALSEKGLLKHLRQDNDANRGRDERNQSTEISQMAASNLMDYYAAAFKSSMQPSTGSETSGKSLAEADDVRKVQAQYLQHQLFLAQQQQILLAQQYQQIMMAAAASSLQQRLSQSSDETSNAVLAQSKQQELMAQNQIWKQLLPQNNLETQSLAQDMKPFSMTEEVSTIFSCGLCGVYGTDDLNSLESHVRKQRLSEGLMDPINSEWVVKDRSRDRENYFCKLCSYSTTLKTNFNLHCKTEKHSCKLNLISHVREGGAATTWMIPHILNGNLAQRVSCNACQFVTHSFEKLKLHCATDQHQGVLNVCQYLQSLMKNQTSLQKEEKNEGNKYQFRCRPCANFSTKHVVEMVKHMQTTEHQLELQKQKSQTMGTLEDVVAVEETDNSAPAKKIENETNNNIQCNCCNYSCDDQARMQLHVMTQHSNHPPTSCPLCQELLKSPLQLRLHLVKAHQLQVSSTNQDASDESPVHVKPTKKEIIPTTEIIERSNDSRDVSCDVGKMEDISMDVESINTGSLVIDEDVDFKGKQHTEPKESDEKTNLEAHQKTLDAGKLASGIPSSKSRFINPNSLIMQVLKGDGLSDTSFVKTSADRMSLVTKATDTDVETGSLSVDAGANPVLRDSTSVESMTLSCPNLLDAVQESASSSQEQHGRRKMKRTRMRSYPLDKVSGGRTFRHLLSKYGLEQARHYVENRSSRNKSRARTFMLEQMEEKWSASFSDPDAAEKENIITELDKKFKKKSTSNNPENRKNEEESLSCSHCGKEFSDLWILRTHEEFAHDICAPTNNVQNVVSPCSDETKEEVEDLQEEKIGLKSPDKPQANDSQSSISGENSVKDENVLVAQQQQHLQNQAVFQTLLKMQSMKQNDSLENDMNRSNPLENLLPGSMLGDAGALSSNLASHMGIYSALVQTQALGIHPYQMLSNVAALQQMQHLASPMLDDISGRSGSTAFSGSHPSVSLSSFENQYRSHGLDSLQKQDASNPLENNSSMLAHIQSQSSSMEIPAKRPRTRITDEQLKILRANFDINNSPSEDQIDEMAQRTGLPPKVIKHWFRNTLFKERQRSKDSPYNFNIPPVMSLEDVQRPSSDKQEDLLKTLPSLPQDDSSNMERKVQEENIDSEKILAANREEASSTSKFQNKHPFVKNLDSDNDKPGAPPSIEPRGQENKLTSSSATEITQRFPSNLFSNALTLVPGLSSKDGVVNKAETATDSSRDGQSMLTLANLNFPKQLLSSQIGWQNASVYDNNDNNMYETPASSENSMFSNISGSLCRRTPRTRFTDFQLQVLQEFFDRNAYPKDDDLDQLSQTLNLSTRVIVVWFQNARQKARKIYEQQQHHQRSQSPPGSDSMQSSLKLDEHLTQATSKGLESLARKTLSEVNKHISDKSNLTSSGPANKETALPSTTENEKSTMTVERKIGQINGTTTCQTCDKTFSTTEEWQAHQQDHVNANFASMLEHYGVNYMKGLVDKQALEKKMDETNTLELDETNSNGNEFALENQSSLLASAALSLKSPSTKEDSLAALSKFFTTEKQSSVNLTPPGGLSLVGAAKRKASASLNLPLHGSSSTKTSFSSNSAPFQNKMSAFVEDKDTGGGVGMHKDPKRLRTTITPEQLEYLYQQYLFDSSPSRKVIEQISEIVGLKKRVVQVWFQNTRARERKGQFRSSIARCVTGQMAQTKLCQLCRMVFRSEEELKHHQRTKHRSQSAEATIYSSDGPSEKKLRLAQPEANDACTTQDLSSLQAVKSLLSTEALKSTNSSFNYMMNDATESISTAPMRNIKTESSAMGAFQTAVLKDEKPLLQSNSHPLEYSKLFGRIQSDLSSSELQSNLTALYSASALNDARAEAASHAALSTLAEPKYLLNASKLSVNLNPATSESESSIVDESDRKLSYKSGSEDDRDATKSRDMIQHMTNQSEFPSMIGNNSAIDGSCTPSKRHRTQMSSAQVRALKHCYKAFKTPTLAECELIGNEVGLLKRVVRVWFQNARAKEKKQKLRQNNGQPLDHGDILEKSEIAVQCEMCLPSLQFTSSQIARDHYFSRDHLQKLMKLVESDKKQDNITGFNTSHSSPCSSYDSSENFFNSDNFGSDSFSEVSSPVMKQHTENSKSPTYTKASSPSMASMVQQKENISETLSSESHNIGSYRNTSESNSITDADQMNSNYSQLFATNPSLFQHYQNAVQLLSQQKDQENDSQALFQQALQKSLYQILKLPQTSPTESQ